MTEAEEIALLLKTAIPIDDVDHIVNWDRSFAIIWIDISERPDLQVLAEKDTLADGFSLCTYFYENPGKRNMRLGFADRDAPAGSLCAVSCVQSQRLD